MAQKKFIAYVGTYTHANSVGIHVYSVDPEKGKLTEHSVMPINNPSYLKVSWDGKFLYSIADEGVAAFRILEDGNLEKLNQEWIGGMRGCYVETDMQRRYLFVGGYHDGRVTMMKLNEDGSIGGIADGIFHQGLGISSVEKRLEPKVTCVDLTPEEKFLCAVDYGLDQTKIYAVDYEKGKLELTDVLRFPAGSAPRILRFSQDGKFAYVMCEGSNELYVYRYSLVAGEPVFEKIQVVSVMKDEKYNMAASSMITFSSEEDYIYVSIDAYNSVACLSRDAETGMLTWEFDTPISGDYPKTLKVLPGDKYFVVLNHDSNEIRTFSIDHEKKCSLMINAPIKIDQPNCIQIHELI
jgi:6-phosphogluconolactonase